MGDFFTGGDFLSFKKGDFICEFNPFSKMPDICDNDDFSSDEGSDSDSIEICQKSVQVCQKNKARKYMCTIKAHKKFGDLKYYTYLINEKGKILQKKYMRLRNVYTKISLTKDGKARGFNYKILPHKISKELALKNKFYFNAKYYGIYSDTSIGFSQSLE